MEGYNQSTFSLEPFFTGHIVNIVEILSVVTDTITDAVDAVDDLNATMKNPEDFNPRNHAYPGDIRQRPLWEILVKVKSYFIIMTVALIGNLTVIATVVRNRRLRTTTNVYILNLAVCDVMVTLCCTWVHLVDDLSEGWVLGAFFCKTNSFSQVLSMVASILTLTVLACDRFFGIVFAMKARLTERRSRLIIGCLWVLSITISLPLLIYRRESTRQWADHTEIWCGDEWPEMTSSSSSTNQSSHGLYSKKIYYTIVSLILYVLPSLIMTVAYGVIMRTLWANKLPGEHISCMEHAQNRKKKKVIIMLLTMLLVFILCWFPFQVSILYSEYRDSLSELPSWYPTFQYIAVFLADSNCAFNPIIYTCFNKSFKSGFKETFRNRQQRESCKWKRETIRHTCQSTSSTFYQTIEMRHYFNRHNRL